MARSPHDRAWVVGKYALLQLPGFLLVALLLAGAICWWGISTHVALCLLALWVLKDIALFPLLRVAYERSGGGGGAEALVDARGVASETLAPAGYVRVGAELWRAELASDDGEAIPSGAPVRVRAVRGLTLIVEPDPERGH
jgi:membrane protein implicated in regulation of membrane protease activity